MSNESAINPVELASKPTVSSMQNIAELIASTTRSVFLWASFSPSSSHPQSVITTSLDLKPYYRTSSRAAVHKVFLLTSMLRALGLNHPRVHPHGAITGYGGMPR
jgi:hypothetical protein